MDFIKALRLVRAVEREASRRGYRGDVLADDPPLIGTLNEQMAIATIGRDTSPGQMSTADREFHNRLVRAAVLAKSKCGHAGHITPTRWRQPRRRII